MLAIIGRAFLMRKRDAVTFPGLIGFKYSNAEEIWAIKIFFFFFNKLGYQEFSFIFCFNKVGYQECLKESQHLLFESINSGKLILHCNQLGY